MNPSNSATQSVSRLGGKLRLAFNALSLALVVGMAAAQTVDNKPEVKKEILDRVTSLLTKSAFVPGIDFEQWPSFLDSERKQIDDSKNDEEFQRAVNTALRKFSASHIVLMTPRAEKIREGATVGIGIRSQIVKDGVEVIRVIRGAPAARAGLVPGDIIVKVDGKPVEGIAGIPGPAGTTVSVTVKHVDGKTEDYKIVRAKFSTVRAEELTWPDPDTAKLTVYTFDFTYSQSNVEKLMKQAHKAKNLILDLRDNGGGAVINLEHLLGLLMNPDQPIGTFISRRLADDYVSEAHGSPTDLEGMAMWSSHKVRPRMNEHVTPYRGNIAVLVNQFSGSASEMCAAALQENVGAKIIGSKSAGAVLVSVIVPAGNGFMLQYPLSDYLTIRGHRLEGAGVKPDIEAKDPTVWLPNAADPCVQAALAYWAADSSPGRESGVSG